MSIAILIATRNRPGDLVPCLQTIFALEGDYSVWVLDQSDKDDSERGVRETLGTPARLHYIRSESRGKSAALNILVREAEGELFAFTDDDTVVPEDWLTTIERAFAQDTRADIVFGQVLPPEGSGPGAHVPCLMFSERRTIPFGERYGMGANMAMRQTLVDKIRGYDEILGPGAPFGAGEEGDMVYRAQLAGSMIVADPSIQLIHRATRNADEWERVNYIYGVGDGAFFTKHIRCGDKRMLQLLLSQLVRMSARFLRGRLRRERRSENHYVRGLWHGLTRSRRYAIDRQYRLYVPRPSAMPDTVRQEQGKPA